MINSRATARRLANKRKEVEKQKLINKENYNDYNNKTRNEFISIIERVLEEYKIDFDIHKVENSSYEWTINNLNSSLVLIGIKLSWHEGTFDGSDDCRNIPYKEWAVTINKNRDVIKYISTVKEFPLELAKIMQQFY